MEKVIYKKSFVSAMTNNQAFSSRKIKSNNYNNISIIKPRHARNKTEPKIVLSNETATKPVTQYFEESLVLLNTIHLYLDQSAENNNKPLEKNKKIKINRQNSLKSKNNHKYIKISPLIKNQILDEIETNSKQRKEIYEKLFLMINESIESIKTNLVENVVVVNENDRESISSIMKLSTIKDESKKEICNFSESAIAEKSSQMKEDNTLINYDDSVEEEKPVNKFPEMVLGKNVLNSSLTNTISKINYTSNISTNLTTQQETKIEKQKNKDENICLIY